MTLHAILWRWPGARCVVRGDVVDRWDGPMARPTDAEITQAVADYTTQGIAAQETRDRDLAMKVIKALAIATHKRFKAGGVTGDTVTAAQWEAALRAEYDALTVAPEAVMARAVPVRRKRSTKVAHG